MAVWTAIKQTVGQELPATGPTLRQRLYLDNLHPRFFKRRITLYRLHREGKCRNIHTRQMPHFQFNLFHFTGPPPDGFQSDPIEDTEGNRKFMHRFRKILVVAAGGEACTGPVQRPELRA